MTWEETFCIQMLAKINVSQQTKFRNLLQQYLDEDDLNDSLIAGGIFLDYQANTLFSQNFPLLFPILQQNQDIDIFILDCEDKKFKKYYKKLIHTSNRIVPNSLEQNTDSDEIYEGVHSFKIAQTNGEKLNFVFIDHNSYPTLMRFLNTFDFTITKTFYAYKSDAIFFPNEILTEYQRICNKYEINFVYEDVATHLECSDKFQKYYTLLWKLLDTNNMKYADQMSTINRSLIQTERDKINTSQILNRIQKQEFINDHFYKLRVYQRAFL